MNNRARFLLITLALAAACRQKPATDTSTAEKEVPLAKAAVFNADSAYAYVAAQVAFGPRVPNSPAHQACGNYLVAKLRQFGATVTEQAFVAQAFDGTPLRSRNLIATINPRATKRILLAAHWDTRPFADQDSVRQDQPIDGANDGGSGVAVLLEVARALQADTSRLALGVDIILFDAEDYGTPEGRTPQDPNKQYYCLGSQYWAANRHVPNYTAYFGILFDMVGAKGARFAREGGSVQYAGSVVSRVWNLAARLGYGSFFINTDSPAITDDHVFVNDVAKIPTIDVIEYDGAGGAGYFGPYWHTHRDNLSVIDRATLKAVGQTTLQTLYQEQ